MENRILVPTFERVDSRGVFTEVLNNGKWESLIHGHMKKDTVIGNHYHKKTTVFFFLTRGSAQINTVHVRNGEKSQFRIDSHQGIILLTNESHSIRFLEDSEFIMLKSLRYDPANPDTFAHPVEA